MVDLKSLMESRERPDLADARILDLPIQLQADSQVTQVEILRPTNSVVRSGIRRLRHNRQPTPEAGVSVAFRVLAGAANRCSRAGPAIEGILSEVSSQPKYRSASLLPRFFVSKRIPQR